MSILAKKQTKTPRKTQKNTTYWKPLEYWISKCQLKGAQFLHLTCQGGGSPPCLPVSYATGST